MIEYAEHFNYSKTPVPVLLLKHCGVKVPPKTAVIVATTASRWNFKFIDIAEINLARIDLVLHTKILLRDELMEKL